VLADVHHGVRAEAPVGGGRLEPPVGSQVVVGGREVGVVVDRHRVLPEPARWLDHDDHVAGNQGGDDDLTGVVDEQPPGGLAPRLGHPVAQRLGQVRGPAVVLLRGDPNVGVRELARREPLLVLPAGGDHGVDQGVACLGVVLEVQARHGAGPPEVVAGLPESAQQPDGRDRGVQADGVADAGVLRRVRREHQRDLLLTVRDVPQPCVVDSDRRDPGAALGVRDVAGESLGVDLLERERRGDDPAVELGDRDLVGGVERGDAVVVGLPLGPAAGETEPLEHGDVERGDALDIPGLVVPSGAHGRRDAAPGRQDGDDEGVEATERLEEVVRGAAQRPGEDRDTERFSGGVHRVGQGVREGSVPRGLVGAVVQDAHPGEAGTVDGVPLREAPGRDRGGRLEPLAGQQHGVGQEGVQLRQVLRSTLGEVAVRLGRDADRHGAQFHQLSAGLLLPAQDDQRGTCRAHVVQALPQVVR